MLREKLKLGDFESRFSHDGNRLYFDDKELQTDVHLTPKQSLLAGAVAVFAILGAVGTCLNTGITFWNTFYNKPVVSQSNNVAKPDESQKATPVQPGSPPNETVSGTESGAAAKKAAIPGKPPLSTKPQKSAPPGPKQD
jgi:hypothetical protein